MKAKDQIADRKDSRALARFLSDEGQALLPMLELIEQAETAVDERIDVTGRATMEAVWTLSGQELAGPKHPGKGTGGDIGWQGEQNGVVNLTARKLRISKPRLRREGKGGQKGKSREGAIPAYRRNRGCEPLWMLKSDLDNAAKSEGVAQDG